MIEIPEASHLSHYITRIEAVPPNLHHNPDESIKRPDWALFVVLNGLDEGSKEVQREIEEARLAVLRVTGLIGMWLIIKERDVALFGEEGEALAVDALEDYPTAKTAIAVEIMVGDNHCFSADWAVPMFGIFGLADGRVCHDPTMQIIKGIDDEF